MTLRALTSALSGLRVHQDWMDVIGDNLANSSTPGFKGSRAHFADLMSQTLRPAQEANAPLSGTNGVQIGLGVRLQSIDLRTAQGSLSETGRPFDLALRGEGFFVLNDGNKDVYTRAGAFGVDSSGTLVDLGTGYAVRNVQGQNLSLGVNQLLAGQATSFLDLGGNLPAEVSGPRAEVLSNSTGFLEGTSAVLAGSNEGPFNFTDGDRLDVSVDGSTVAVTFQTSDFADLSNVSLAELTDYLNDALSTLAVTVDDRDDVLTLTSKRVGAAASIEILDGPGDPAAEIGLADSASGTETAATAATRLNDLVFNQTDHVDGDELRLTGTDAAGNRISADFRYGSDGTTLGELAAFVDGLYPDASTTIDAAGNLVVTADATGEATLSLSIQDRSGNTGASDFDARAWIVSEEGLGPDEATTSVDVYDGVGVRHTVDLRFTRTGANEWQLEFSAADGDDSVNSGPITVRFAKDGSLLSPSEGSVELSFGGAGSQSLSLNLGSIGALDGLTQLGSDTGFAVVDQDGFPPGELASVAVRSDGVIEGLYDNGQVLELDQLAVATFTNSGGLDRLGDTLFARSLNSGDPILQTAGTGRAGAIVAGALEDSNVEVAEEFVRLIEAQRGFQANARVIRASDEMLTEVVRLV